MNEEERSEIMLEISEDEDEQGMEVDRCSDLEIVSMEWEKKQRDGGSVRQIRNVTDLGTIEIWKLKMTPMTMIKGIEKLELEQMIYFNRMEIHLYSNELI